MFVWEFILLLFILGRIKCTKCGLLRLMIPASLSLLRGHEFVQTSKLIDVLQLFWVETRGARRSIGRGSMRSLPKYFGCLYLVVLS